MQLKIPAYAIKNDSLLIKLKKIKALWAFNNYDTQYLKILQNNLRLKDKYQ